MPFIKRCSQNNREPLLILSLQQYFVMLHGFLTYSNPFFPFMDSSLVDAHAKHSTKKLTQFKEFNLSKSNKKPRLGDDGCSSSKREALGSTATKLTSRFDKRSAARPSSASKPAARPSSATKPVSKSRIPTLASRKPLGYKPYSGPLPAYKVRLCLRFLA